MAFKSFICSKTKIFLYPFRAVFDKLHVFPVSSELLGTRVRHEGGPPRPRWVGSTGPDPGACECQQQLPPLKTSLTNRGPEMRQLKPIA